MSRRRFVEEPRVATVETEEALIAQLVGRPALAPPSVLGVGIRPEHFADPGYRTIFAAVRRISERGETPDAAAVENELRRRGKWSALAAEHELVLQGAHNTAAPVEAVLDVAHTRASELLRARRDEQVSQKLTELAEAMNGRADQRKATRLLAELALLNAEDTGEVRLEPLWLRDALARELPPERHYVEGVLQAGVLAEIAGLPYTYKSAFALELAHKVAAGRGEILGRFPVTAQAPVAYLWGDDSQASELGRLQAYARRHGFAEEPVAFYLNPPLVLPEHLPALAAELERHAFGLVVLDSVYNFAPGLNWNDNAEVTRLYGALKRLCDERSGLTILLVDHAPKPSESTRDRHASISSFGSVFKAASVRCSITLEREGETLWMRATGNNVPGFKRSLAVFDEEALELRLVEQVERDYGAEALAFLADNPGSTRQDVAKGIGCRPENARDALAAAEANGEAHRDAVERRDAAGRRRTAEGWFLGEPRHTFPTLGEAWEGESAGAGRGDRPSAAPLAAPVRGRGARDGLSGQGSAGGGSA